MKIEQAFHKMMMSQLRTELYLAGLFAIELARTGAITTEELKEIILGVNESIEKNIKAQEVADTAEKETSTWQGSKNLAA